MRLPYLGLIAASTPMFLILAFGPASIPAQVSEAQLVGEWVGTWTGTLYQGTGAPPAPTQRGVKNNGDYVVTITKVEGEKVYGQVQQPGLIPMEKFNFVGTLNQNTLSYGNERYQTQLTIEGDRMNGTRTGGPVPFQISLRKKK